MSQPQPKGLENHTIVLMVAVALFYDALQALLTIILMGWLITPIAFLTFYLWFKLHGITFMTPKRGGSMALGFLIEIFPLTSWLPAWTAVVSFIALDSKIKKIAPGLDIIKK